MTHSVRGEPGPDSAAHTFAVHRALLFTIAYEITGSVADAEDVVQESWLRWSRAPQDDIRSAKPYLAQIVTRLALNAVRSRDRRRETYVGPWLPEPLITAPDVAEDVVLAESVSTAVLVVLDTLPPVERAVFVLREVFGFEHAEIAAAVDRTEVAVRQIAHRARAHVRARRPDQPRTGAEPEELVVLQRFFAAGATGDLQALMDVLAPQVVLLSDGGGIRQAALRPITGSDKVARFLLGVIGKLDPGTLVDYRGEQLNGGTGLVVRIDGEIDTVLTCEVSGDRVIGVFLVRNPDKLGALEPRPLAR